MLGYCFIPREKEAMSLMEVERSDEWLHGDEVIQADSLQHREVIHELLVLSFVLVMAGEDLGARWKRFWASNIRW